ncbi:MAG: hypothetical protein GX640_11790 [Fibrobacter sp.]|nr:hypothetical protein [Fibrobacter sp.]
MALVRFEIENYQVTIGPDLPSIVTNLDSKVVGIIGCYGKGYQLILNFVENGAVMPLSAYDEEKKTGSLYLPVSYMGTYIDILRNEKPVFAYCNSERPEWSNISTSYEPVGEGERR